MSDAWKKTDRLRNDNTKGTLETFPFESIVELFEIQEKLINKLKEFISEDKIKNILKDNNG